MQLSLFQRNQIWKWTKVDRIVLIKSSWLNPIWVISDVFTVEINEWSIWIVHYYDFWQMISDNKKPVSHNPKRVAVAPSGRYRTNRKVLLASTQLEGSPRSSRNEIRLAFENKRLVSYRIGLFIIHPTFCLNQMWRQKMSCLPKRRTASKTKSKPNKIMEKKFFVFCFSFFRNFTRKVHYFNSIIIDCDAKQPTELYMPIQRLLFAWMHQMWHWISDEFADVCFWGPTIGWYECTGSIEVNLSRSASLWQTRSTPHLARWLFKANFRKFIDL